MTMISNAHTHIRTHTEPVVSVGRMACKREKEMRTKWRKNKRNVGNVRIIRNTHRDAILTDYNSRVKCVEKKGEKRITVCYLKSMWFIWMCLCKLYSICSVLLWDSIHECLLSLRANFKNIPFYHNFLQ